MNIWEAWQAAKAGKIVSDGMQEFRMRDGKWEGRIEENEWYGCDVSYADMDSEFHVVEEWDEVWEVDAYDALKGGFEAETNTSPELDTWIPVQLDDFGFVVFDHESGKRVPCHVNRKWRVRK